MEKTENKSSKLTEIIVLIFGILCFVLVAAELTTNLNKTFSEEDRVAEINKVPPEAKQPEPQAPEELHIEVLKEMLSRGDL